MNNAVADEVVILAVIEHRKIKHARVFDRAAHQFVILNAMSVVGNGNDPGLGQRADRRQFLTGEIFGNGAGREDTDRRNFRRVIGNPGDRARAVRRRRSVRHANDRSKTARRGRARARRDCFLPAEPGLAEMHVDVDETGTNDEIGCVDLIGLMVDG